MYTFGLYFLIPHSMRLPKFPLFIILGLFSAGLLSAQKGQDIPDYELLPKLSPADSAGLVGLPLLKMPDELKGALDELPYEVDNAEQIYWRPVFAQQQFECGQASSIGLGFTKNNQFSLDMAYQYRFANDAGKTSMLDNLGFSQDVDEHALYLSLIYYP